ncbi:MAG: CobD/CbiB family cobalamin biosynthesis protein, partial [Clostridiales bacterium]
MLIYALIALIIGFVLDLWWGDPQNFPHLIRLMGKMIAKLEKWLRHLFPTNETGERTAGKILVFLIGITWLLIPLLLVLVAYGLSPWLGLGVEALFCWQLLATKSLMTESGKVYNSLLRGDLPQARQDVAMIVGRDTENLDLAGVTKATVETVAENVADGVVAPLFYLMLGGSCLGALYKAINTMDSMVGYKNAVYL